MRRMTKDVVRLDPQRSPSPTAQQPKVLKRWGQASGPAPEIPEAVRAYIEEHSLYGAVKSRYGRDGVAISR
jgi:hypothetical protein